MAVEITTGDDVAIVVQLTKNGAPFIITPAAPVKAVLRSGTTPVSSEIVLDELHAEADWATSKVVVEFSSAETASFPTSDLPYDVNLEIQVDDGGKKTWIARNIAIRVGIIA